MNSIDDILDALLNSSQNGVLAVIAHTLGPSYRAVGAMMAVLDGGERLGTLSSGCIEADIALHAAQVANDGRAQMLRYGEGSPFIDIELPCGGGLDIVLIPQPNKAVLAQMAVSRKTRQSCTLEIDTVSGDMRLIQPAQTGLFGTKLCVRLNPDIQFYIFGKGAEASTMTAIVRSVGYSHLLLSPDSETLDNAERQGCASRHLVSQSFPADLLIDEWTAIVLFFHDHDWEPPILAGALMTSAFYVGAQGSQRARDARLVSLTDLGVTPEAIKRLHGPIGLIRSVRDPVTLAVSVLAEVLQKAASARV